MGHTDPNGAIAYTLGDHRRFSSHITTIAAQQPNMVDGKVAPDIFADADYTVVLSNGSTYLVTLSPTTTRVIKVPEVSIPTGHRLYFRFDLSAAGNTVEVRGDPSNVLIADVSGTTIDEGLCIQWNGSSWHSLRWTSGVNITL